MPRRRFRDRFFTRQTAEAMVAPSAIIVAGAGAAAGVLAGARTSDVVIDPRTLRDPWRAHVRDALEAEQRFLAAVESTNAGPLRDRMADMAGRVSNAVHESWRIANRGQQLEVALGQLPPIDRLERELAQARGHDRIETAVRAQIATYRRIEATAIDARERLRLLDARLDETVARAIEVGLRAGDPVEVGMLDDDVESLVTEMEALRRGLDETRLPTAGAATTGGARPAAGSDRQRGSTA
jgi:hypothetical protein